MSDVTGPIRTLPGARRTPPAGTRCDNHPEVLAITRLQGETDSFGSEQLDLCAECVAAHEKDRVESRTGVCEWCRADAVDLRPARDYDEGMSGRVYDVCGACIKRENELAAAELDDNWGTDWGWL